jgi:hypothetical protein
MTRLALPFHVPDIALLARQLERQLAQSPEKPGHLALLNMLARGAGFANYQAFRASALAGTRLTETGAMPDMTRVAQARRYFDAQGRMTSWPAKTNLQYLCLWVIWAHFPKGVVMSERQASALINQWHLFGDAAIIRRTMWERKMISRTEDGRNYCRVEQAPEPEAKALIKAVLGGT